MHARPKHVQIAWLHAHTSTQVHYFAGKWGILGGETWHTLVYSPIGSAVVLELRSHSRMFNYGDAKDWHSDLSGMQPHCPIVCYQDGAVCKESAETFRVDSCDPPISSNTRCNAAGVHKNALLALLEKEFGSLAFFSNTLMPEDEVVALRVCKNGHLTCTFKSLESYPLTE